MSRVILHIDNDQTTLEGLEIALSAEGFQVVFSDGADAVPQLELSEQPPDLILLEIRLESRDGFELFTEIRSLEGAASQVPVIILTRASRSPRDFGRALGLGANDFLTKPVVASELVQSIRQACVVKETPIIDLDQPIDSPMPDATVPGDIASTSLCEVVGQLHATGARGILFAQCGQTRVGIQLRNGSPVSLASNRQIEPLEDYFLRSGKITQNQYDEVLGSQLGGLRSPLERLIGLDLLSEQDVDDAIVSRTDQLIASFFKWESGQFRFEKGKRLHGAHVLEIRRSPISILWEAALEHASDQQICAFLARQYLLYPSAVMDITRAGVSDDLSSVLRKLLSEIDGSSTVGEFLESGEATRRGLFALWLTGFVEFGLHPVSAPAKEPRADSCPAAQDSRDRVFEPEIGPAAQDSRDTAFEPEIGPAAQDSRDTAFEPEMGPAAQDSRDTAFEPEMGPTAQDSRDTAFEPEIGPAAQGSKDGAVEPRTGRDSDQADATISMPERQPVGEASASRDAVAPDGTGAESPVAEEAAPRAHEAESWFRKGEAFFEDRRYSEAIEAFGMCSHLDPGEGEYVSHLGYVMYLVAPDDVVVQREALEHIANGIRLSPNSVKPYLYMAKITKSNEDYAVARRLYQRVLKIDPDCHTAHQELRLMERRKQTRDGGFMRKMRKKPG